MNDLAEKIDLLRLHPSVDGLEDAAIEEIAAAAEIVRCQAGDFLCRPNEPVTSVYLVVNGRMRLQILDLHGRVVVERFQKRGGQVGGLAAALAEPQPFVCTAEDPSVLLRLGYADALAFARKYDPFRANYARLMAEAVRQAMLRDKSPVPPRIVAFFHSSEATRVITRRLFARLADLGDALHVFADRPVAVPGVQERGLVEEGETLSPETVRRQAAEWLKAGRVVFDASMAMESGQTARIADACEQVYWCVTPGDWEATVEPLGSLLARAPTLRDKIRIVWLLPAGAPAPVARALRELAHSDVKVCLDQPTANFGAVGFAGLERLTHQMRGLQIGVALGGGAARGMAHLGVLPALEQGGVTVDMIAGTSAGAMTGALYSAGLPADYLIERFVADLRPSWLFRHLPRGEQWDLLYKYRRGRFDPMLRKYLAELRLEQLALPMHTIAVDLIGGREVTRSSGDAVHAVLESINLPLLSTPINREGEALVDGGLINNIPANVLAAKGCNFVIAVSVTAKMEQKFADNRPDTSALRMRRASTIETLLRSYLVQSHSINALGVQPADFVIEPDVTGFELSAFGKTKELATVGRQSVEAVVSQVRSLLNRWDAKLFP